MAIPPGTCLGHYEIRSKLGAGGMGEVYLAQDTRLDRKVALKVLPYDVASNQDRMRRFVQEAKAAAALNHPNIAHIYEIDEADGVNFMAMEFIDGQTLRECLVDRNDLPTLLRYLQHSAEGLAKAHAAGIVHRDLKPDNIMITRDGHAKILDFGLAKLVEPQQHSNTSSAWPSEDDTAIPAPHSAIGTVIGTAGYMSPEQARGRTNLIDERSDIFSFGCILYEAVTGQKAFKGEDRIDSLNKIIRAPVPPISNFNAEVPSDLQKLVRRCLEKDPEERYQSIKDVAMELKELRRALVDKPGSGLSTARSENTRPYPETASDRTGTGVLGRPTASLPTRPSSAEYFVTEIKHHPRAVTIIGLAVLTLAATAVYFAFFRKTAPLTDKDTILIADFANNTGDTVFDGTLRQALAAQLGQSPFLNIFGDQRVRDSLRFLGRSPDERVTRELAREICQRQGLKAFLTGSISGVGTHYVLTVEAVNAQTGDALAREQVEADSKEQVIRKLGEATTRLRVQLGESLASIQKFDAPIEQATTSSLEAFKAYSIGLDNHLKGSYFQAIPFYKRAIELDPSFAIAYARLASVYANTGQRDLATEAAQKAYELRDRVSEREKFYITAYSYYGLVTREREKYIETLELWKHTYPLDPIPHIQLSNLYDGDGLLDKAIEEANEAIRLNPNAAAPRDNLAVAYMQLNRWDEARDVYRQALDLKLDSTFIRNGLHSIAFVKGDAAAMKQQIDWLTGRPDEYNAPAWQAEVALFSGQLQKARALTQRAVELALGRKQNDAAAQLLAGEMQNECLFGNCDRGREIAARAFAISRDTTTIQTASAGFSLCGDTDQAQRIMDEISKRFPNYTLVNIVYWPLNHALIATRHGDPARAVQLLEPALRYEVVGNFWPQYIRGKAYLSLHKGAEASAEFQKILDHRGWSPRSALYPLAYVGSAQAAVMNGDTAKARKAYEDFFALWKDADPDNLTLIEAKKEYEKLK
jgi:serine/threonine protein kinase/tetratricopeptide (TPR) repeat protein